MTASDLKNHFFGPNLSGKRGEPSPICHLRHSAEEQGGDEKSHRRKKKNVDVYEGKSKEPPHSEAEVRKPVAEKKKTGKRKSEKNQTRATARKKKEVREKVNGLPD